MTGTSMSKTFMEFDCHRNQEWLRRRKLRLEQVRKQSNEIAKALRHKVINDEKARHEEYDRMSEVQFKDWKAEKLDELEKKLKCALDEFGKSYKLAEAESIQEDVIEERKRVNLARAQKRGEIAKQEELKKKKMMEENKRLPIQRKINTRKREDLRSALVRSVALKKQLIDKQEFHGKSDHLEKVSLKNKRKNKTIPHKFCICNCQKADLEVSPFKPHETVWINLDDVQNSSGGDSGLPLKSSKTSTSNEKCPEEKPDGAVEYYDFSSRYHCRSFKEFPHLVERIDPESQVLNANELAKLEDEKEKEEVKKKLVVDSVTQERGMEALRREKIKREYNYLMGKLEELNKKEKILKTQQRIPPSFLHMNDERLFEKVRTKQRIMESEFEKIYYKATSRILTESPQPECRITQGGGDFVKSDDGISVKLSFSPSNLKANSVKTTDEEFSSDSLPEEVCRRPKKMKKKRILLSHIDKALREGRELRKAISRKRDANTSEDEEIEIEEEEIEIEEEEIEVVEEEEESEKSSSETKTAKEGSVESSPLKDEGESTRSENLRAENLKNVEKIAKENSLKEFDKVEDDSLPLSSSTSYKSPPNVIKSYRLRRVLDYLEKVSQIEDDTLKQSSSKFKRKIEKLVQDLTILRSSSSSEEESKKHFANPTLQYYIEKLLNMSRECIANLSVSSENVSTPNITDCDVKNEKGEEVEYFSRISSRGEDIIRNSRLERANQLEETIKNWKMILEKNSEQPQPKAENLVDCSCSVPVEEGEVGEKEPKKDLCVLYSPKIKNKYDEITKKCSERISQLSNMLDKVRKDKEKLLSSTSDGSSLVLCKDDGLLEEEFEADEAEELLPAQVGFSENVKTSPSLENLIISRYNLTQTGNAISSTSKMIDCQELEESLDSWPDVMDELLKREILTSPFKWSGADYSEFTIVDSRPKPSSVETVIGNFRKEINKIKPTYFSDSFLEMNAKEKPQLASIKDYRGLFSNPNETNHPPWTYIEDEQLRQEESSVDSINYALTRLGLNWAKSFLRKNEESKAMSSSSTSEEKNSDEDCYP